VIAEHLPAREALRLHYAASRLPADGGRGARHWKLELGPLALRLRNFEWRRRALPYHDLHHVLTGYACTPGGELEMAAWEFAAGRFPSVLSTLFCLPLVGAGALVAPRRSFRAFVRGRHSRTLYCSQEDPFGLSVRELREKLLPPGAPRARPRDVALYAGLAAASLLPAFAAIVLLV
jgi:hypothetical protein